MIECQREGYDVEGDPGVVEGCNETTTTDVSAQNERNGVVVWTHVTRGTVGPKSTSEPSVSLCRDWGDHGVGM